MRDEPMYLTPKDVAKRLQVHEETVLRWIRTGKLHAIKLDRGYRIDPDDFQKFLAERRK